MRTHNLLSGSVCFLGILFAQAELERTYREAQQAQARGDLKGAIRNYELIVKAQPGMAEAHANLGSLYYQAGDDSRATAALNRPEEAMAEYRKALALNPQVLNVHFAIGNLLWVQNDFERAIPELLAELKLNPAHAEAHYEAGESYIQLNDFDEYDINRIAGG